MFDLSRFFTGIPATAGATMDTTDSTVTITEADAQKLLDGLNAFDELFPQLTLHDRCDSCPQPAITQVMINASLPNLLFCGHHWRRIRETMLANEDYLVHEPDDLYALPQR